MSIVGPDIISAGVGRLTLECARGSLGRIHLHPGDGEKDTELAARWLNQLGKPISIGKVVSVPAMSRSESCDEYFKPVWRIGHRRG